MRTYEVATKRQVELIRTLERSRKIPVAGTTLEQARTIERLEDVLDGGKYVSRQEASDVITWLLGLPSRETEPHG